MNGKRQGRRDLKNVDGLTDIVLGDEFIVAQRSNGLIEVFDRNFNILSMAFFTNVEKVNANSQILLIRKNGEVDFFDKWLNYQFTKK